jgi:hypothetical protein
MQTYQVNSIRKTLFARKKMNNDSFWKNCPALTSFIYPWNDETPPATIFRALHDSKNFYFRFDVIDTEIIAEKGSMVKMSVLNSDRVEIFFRTDEEMNLYYGLEMDPLGRVLDYRAEFYRKFDYKWEWPGITIRASYTLNGYRVWACIPLESLRALKLLSGNKLQAGLFRGKCISDSKAEVSFKWISWMEPESETPDFHIPSAFGELVLEEKQ